VVFNTVGSPQALQEDFHCVRDAGTFVEVGNFVDYGSAPINPVIEDERPPLPELITHRLPLGNVEGTCEAIREAQPLDGRKSVKIVVDASP